MGRLFMLTGSTRSGVAVDTWMTSCPGELGSIARRWFDVIRECGDDVYEILHDGHPTACVEDAAFAYLNVFTRHVNVGFFNGAELNDPCCLLEGSGKFMRHVKIRPAEPVAEAPLVALIRSSYADVKRRLEGEREPELDR